MDLHATEWNEVLIATCEKWLEKQCTEAVRRFPLYGGAVELTVGQATPEIYEAFCAALQGECLYESHMAGNFYRLLTVRGESLYLYYTAADHRIRTIFGCNVPPKLLSEPCRYGAPICTPTLDVLNMRYDLQGGQNNGLGLVLTLEDGSFLIYDGGFKNEDGDRLLEYLRSHNRRSDGILVSAWILTHGHADHYGALQRILREYSSLLDVRCFLLNPVQNCLEGTDGLGAISEQASQVYPNAVIAYPHSGMRFVFSGFTVEVLFTHEDILPRTVGSFNNASTVTRIIAPDGLRCLVMGDMQSESRVTILAQAMGDYLKSDILQVPHHGDSGGTEELYRLIDPSIVIYPTSNEKFSRICKETWTLAPNAFLLNRLHVKRVIVADGQAQTVFG